MLAGLAARGVEVDLIDQSNVKSYVTVSDPDGDAVIEHVPPGTYLIGARELTPNGPCYNGTPSSGFLTTFYQDDQTSTNDPAAAASVVIGEQTERVLDMLLIKSRKKFDCYFVDPGLNGVSACITQGKPVDCFESLVHPGVHETPVM